MYNLVSNYVDDNTIYINEFKYILVDIVHKKVLNNGITLLTLDGHIWYDRKTGVHTCKMVGQKNTDINDKTTYTYLTFTYKNKIYMYALQIYAGVSLHHAIELGNDAQLHHFCYNIKNIIIKTIDKRSWL